jgi:HK97 family phage major capsid protein
MNPEVKKILDELNKAFADFKTANDERLKQIEAKGSADPLLVTKVDKANAEITKLSDQIKAIETSAARINAGGQEATANEARSAARFFSLVRNEQVDEVSAGDVETFRAYKKAFNKYLRKGADSIGTDARNALQVGADPAGGYFVEPDSSGRIVKLIFESSPIRQIADVQPISTDTLEGFNDLDEVSTGWVGEQAARPETNTPEAGKWRIVVAEQYAMPKTTQKLLDDAQVDVGAWLEGKTADKLSRTENAAFVGGDGVNKPRGFTTYPVLAGAPAKANWGKIAQVNSGAAGAFAAVNPGDKLIDLVFGLKAAYRIGANFIMARATVAEARKLKDGQGNYLWQPDFSTQQGARLLGFPIVEAEDMPALAANSLSLGFGNFKVGYQIVDRQGIRVLRDPFTAKPYILFYTTKRVGGDVVNFEAIRLMKFA